MTGFIQPWNPAGWPHGAHGDCVQLNVALGFRSIQLPPAFVERNIVSPAP